MEGNNIMCIFSYIYINFVRYLGVPLITSKLKATDCKVLVDKITARVKSWTNKSLSYAGRVQLIQSGIVLHSSLLVWFIHTSKESDQGD